MFKFQATESISMHINHRGFTFISAARKRERRKKYRCAGAIGVIKFMERNKSKGKCKETGKDKEMLISPLAQVHVSEIFRAFSYPLSQKIA